MGVCESNFSRIEVTDGMQWFRIIQRCDACGREVEFHQSDCLWVGAGYLVAQCCVCVRRRKGCVSVISPEVARGVQRFRI